MEDILYKMFLGLEFCLSQIGFMTVDVKGDRSRMKCEKILIFGIREDRRVSKADLCLFYYVAMRSRDSV